ncbi:ATP synthase subunit f, mitochondrial [Vanrija pseudolonga]|uniref:ATP synthase subunit f, mitochondrial n=1 Tax=Vanrija pseudolonga TaxID=143232 RepID=A0AAF0Y6S4_9TREE|nr:ATP synthase subunit f, mitochondrial [Vanrija pseudolonga]
MFASAARRSLTGLIPPKIATPGAVVRVGSSGTTSARTQAVIDFYSKLPKGPATEVSGGIRGRYFEGKNASGKPILATIGALFLIGYTIDYQMHLKHHKNGAH